MGTVWTMSILSLSFGLILTGLNPIQGSKIRIFLPSNPKLNFSGTSKDLNFKP